MNSMQIKQLNTRKVGAEKEVLAARYLIALGYRIIEMNFFSRIGEIDIIGIEDEILTFVEVKYRKDFRCGPPSLAVNNKKQYTIMKVARYYLLTHPAFQNMQCRFDVVALTDKEIKLYRNAFM